MTKDNKDEPLTPWQQAYLKSHDQPSESKRTHNQHQSKSFKSGRSKKKRVTRKLTAIQKQNLKRISPAIIFGLLAIVLCCYYISPFSKVNELKIVGNHFVEVTRIKKETKINKTTLVLSVIKNQGKIEKRLVNHDNRIQAANVKVTGLQSVVVKVKEFPVIGYLQKNNNYYQILQSGRILANKTKQPRDGYPILVDFKNAKKLTKTIKQYRTISASIRANIQSIALVPSKINPNRILIKMNDGNLVYASISSFGDKMAYYPSITAKLKTKSVIDMQVGAYSYPQSKNKAKTTTK